MAGSSKSLSPPWDLAQEWGQQPRDPEWFWHAAYVASANPSRSNAAQNSDYLAFLLEHADKYGIAAIVLHTGATADREIEEVLDTMFEFLNDYSILDLLSTTKTKIAVELGANVSEFNCAPGVFAEACRDQPDLGWCLDLAHCNAAGVPWEELREVIKQYPPLVSHVNFPGSAFGSGKDIHGWRSAPKVTKYGPRTKLEETVTVSQYDETLHLLALKSVPLIWEGSGLEGSNAQDEFQFISGLLKGL
jgi:hypothetical protein